MSGKKFTDREMLFLVTVGDVSLGDAQIRRDLVNTGKFTERELADLHNKCFDVQEDLRQVVEAEEQGE